MLSQIGMLIGGILWAYIIGSVCGVITNLNPHEIDFRQTYDNLNYMLHDQNITQGPPCAFTQQTFH